MPNDAYQRRLAEWEKKERERKASMEGPPPYEPNHMRSRIPWGCAMFAMVSIIVLAYAFYRYFKLHG